MRGLIADRGLDGEIQVESAGTGDWHVGHPPDQRSVAAARERGVELAGSARQVRPADFRDFDLLVAMDRRNRDELLALAADEAERCRVKLLREYGDGVAEDVPDPYYGGLGGFAEVVRIVERCCTALLEEIRPASAVQG